MIYYGLADCRLLDAALREFKTGKHIRNAFLISHESENIDELKQKSIAIEKERADWGIKRFKAERQRMLNYPELRLEKLPLEEFVATRYIVSYIKHKNYVEILSKEVLSNENWDKYKILT